MEKNKSMFDLGKNKPDKISFGQLAAYGTGGIIPIALFNVAGILVGLMGNISLGLSAFWLGFILIIPRLWDAVSDPIIGHLSDNARTRWGRRRPFLLLGGILVAIFFVLIWWIPKGEVVEQWFGSEAGFQLFQLSYILIALLLFYTATTIFEIPHGALGMEMTTEYHERTKLFSAKSFFGNIFAMSTPWLFVLANLEMFKGPGGNEADGMRYVSIMIAAILIPLSFWWFFKLKEPGFKKVSNQPKTRFWQDMRLVVKNRNFVFLTLSIFSLAMGFNFVQLLGSYIPIFYVFSGDKLAGATLLGINGTVWAVTGVLAVFPLNLISPLLGKRKTLMIAMGLMILAQLSKIVCYNPDFPYLIIIPTVLLSAGMLFFFTLGSSMVGDICDEEELNTGKRTEGSYYAVFWWFIKMGTALASFVSGALIVLTMFDETQVTKVDKLIGTVNEMSAKLELFAKKDSLSDSASVLFFKSEAKTALNESNDYVKFLTKEHEITKSNTDVQFSKEKLEWIDQTLILLKSDKETISDLVKNNRDYKRSTLTPIEGSFPVLLRTKLYKARFYALELQEHLWIETTDLPTHDRKENEEHYMVLNQTMEKLLRTLSEMDNTVSIMDAKKGLKSMSKDLTILKRQTPFTLLMMRI
ncbi:MAG TPA: hypothetical protein DCQ58_05290, partial [Saprospirales bacterium]|nr:hypothetical protein [Saprospirales bacterium]